MGRHITLLKTPFFVVSVILYLGIQLSRAMGTSLHTIVNSYLTDIVCIPIVLIVITTGIRLLLNNQQFWPTLEMTLSLTSLFAVLFELVLPKIDERHTADMVDIICYFLGLLLFYKFKATVEKKIQ